MNNNDKPLWMPKGSVRSILTLALTFGILIFVAIAVEVPEALWGMVGMMLGWYVRDRVKPEG